DPWHLALPSLAKLGRRVGVVRDEHRADVIADRSGDVDGLHDRAIDRRDGDDDTFLAMRGLDDEVAAYRELLPGRLVLAADEEEDRDLHRDEDHDEVRARRELHGRHDDEDDGREDRTARVDRGPPGP